MILRQEQRISNLEEESEDKSDDDTDSENAQINMTCRFKLEKCELQC